MKTMITIILTRRTVVMLGLCLLGLASQARGQVVIDWSSEVNSLFFDSGASALDPSYNFKLGVFDTSGGWSPSLANVGEWESEWTEIDSAVYNPVDGYFSGSYLLADNNTLAVGTQVYMWIYDSLAAPGPNEWLLMTDDGADGNPSDNWSIPLAQPYDPNCNCGTLPQNWVVLNQPGTTNPIVGGLSNFQGPGDYTATPPDFDYQTATVIVPEPASVLLPGLALLGLLIRRRSR